MLFENQDDLEGIYHWYWDYSLDIERLTLPSCEVAGTGEWTVHTIHYDNSNDGHIFEGSLALDGGESLAVSYEAHFSGNLH